MGAKLERVLDAVELGLKVAGVVVLAAIFVTIGMLTVTAHQRVNAQIEARHNGEGR